MTDEELRDADRLNWMQSKHTLHGGVDILYVVDGYQIQLTRDAEWVGQCHHGETLRDAIDAAMRSEVNP